MAHQDFPALEMVTLTSLKPHPRNTHAHPPHQIAELVASLEQHGLYRNVVIANDGTLLAGHGVVEAAQAVGLEALPVRRLPVDPDAPEALQVLIGDNGIAHLAMRDDRALTDMLRDLAQEGEAGLRSTGFDVARVAALAYVTRTLEEIGTIDQAADWVAPGSTVPSRSEAGQVETPWKVVLSFRSAEDRRQCLEVLGLPALTEERQHGVVVWHG